MNRSDGLHLRTGRSAQLPLPLGAWLARHQRPQDAGVHIGHPRNVAASAIQLLSISEPTARKPAGYTGISLSLRQVNEGR